MAKQVINIGTAANDGTGETVRSAFDKVNDNFNEVYNSDNITEGTTNKFLLDDAVSYSKLGVEYTTSGAVTTDLDFSANQVFTKTMTGNTTFTFSNANVGMVKDFVLTGDFVPTFPAGTKVLAGTYDGTVSNLIQIVAIANGDYWLSISQEVV